MTFRISTQCDYCVWFRGERERGEWTEFCKAFPRGRGIPDAILGSRHDHREPFPGDLGVRFTPRDAEAAATAADLIAWRRAHPPRPLPAWVRELYERYGRKD